MANYPPDYQKTVQFHGHLCPGITIGYLAVKTAIARLGIELAGDEERIAIVESNSCGIDAVKFLLNCTPDKGNLIIKDLGNQAYTVGNWRTGQAVRVVMTGEMPALTPEQQALRSLVADGRASAAEQTAWQEIRQSRIDYLMTTPPEQLFKVEDIALDLCK